MTLQEIVEEITKNYKIKFRHKLWPKGVYVECRRNQLVYSKSSMRFSDTTNYYGEVSHPNDYFILDYEVENVE